MEVVLAPYGIFFIEGGKVVKKEVWLDPKEAAKSFFTREVEEKIRGFERRKVDIMNFALEQRVFEGEDECIRFLNRFGLELTKLQMKIAYERDAIAIQLTSSIEEIERCLNSLYERAGEFFGIYFPEAMEKMELEAFFPLLLSPNRGEIAKKLGISEESMGYELSDGELDVLKRIGRAGCELIELRERCIEQLEETLKGIAPNLLALVGPTLAGKLLKLAGGLARLASMPSSTIQVLGAEKALFRHLRKGAKPPKHGILLAHPLVKGAKHRGRAARSLAAKIAIAVRADFYGKGKLIGESLLEELKEKLKSFK